jgi:SRSO17 transposase
MAAMDRLTLEESGSRFVAFVESLSKAIGHRDRTGPLRDYCAGLLAGCKRKSVEPLAAITAPARISAQHQSLLHFVGQAPWSNATVLGKVRELTQPLLEKHGLHRNAKTQDHRRLGENPATMPLLLRKLPDEIVTQ